MAVINALQAYQKIRNSKGRFTASFTKRENGDRRIILAERRPSRGGKYRPESKLCCVVWDVIHQDYRNIPLDGLHRLRFGNRSFVVKGFKVI